jgi:hypothetical protein
MNFSISRSRDSIWVWLFWGIGIYLLLEAGPLLIAGWVLKKTAGELAGPYLAFAVPAAIIMPLIWLLRKWEEKGTLPKRVARAWGLSAAFFCVAVMVALFYSGAELRLMNTRDALAGFVVTALWGGFIVYFTMYHMALRRISARAASKCAST